MFWEKIRGNPKIGDIQHKDSRVVTIIFAYQFMVGMGYNLSPTTTVTAGYRFFQAIDPEFTAPIGLPFESEYQTHEFNVGVRFAF